YLGIHSSLRASRAEARHFAVNGRAHAAQGFGVIQAAAIRAGHLLPAENITVLVCREDIRLRAARHYVRRRDYDVPCVPRELPRLVPALTVADFFVKLIKRCMAGESI